MDECYAEQVNRFLESDAPVKTRNLVSQSLKIVDEAVKRFHIDHLALSFNGGKDCLVMLYLILAVLPPNTKLPTVYIRCDNTFREVDDFVEECSKVYGLEVEAITSSMKPALSTYLKNHTQVNSIFVGIRRADPYTNGLQSIQKTDAGWPDFMRIHPVLEWEYDDIWVFLRYLRIPYCILYDQGYTSLGSTTSTIRNPGLKRADGTYRPAYELMDNDLERVGRT